MQAASTFLLPVTRDRLDNGWTDGVGVLKASTDSGEFGVEAHSGLESTTTISLPWVGAAESM